MNYQKLKDSDKIVLSGIGGVERSFEILPPGVYKLSNMGSFCYVPAFEELKTQERIVNFSSGEISDFIKESEFFFDKRTKDIYNEMGITHKIGFIIYGKHGTGKTCLSLNMMRIMMEKFEAICLDCTKEGMGFGIYTAKEMRKYQSNPIVIFVDECEDDIKGSENKYLSFLDGTDSISNTMFIGCTNYLDKIPERIRNRKSRIKKCYEIKGLPVSVYKELLLTKVPAFNTDLISEICYKAAEKELTLDQFKEALLNHQLNGTKIDIAITEALVTYE